ncbi:MAG: polynucleotide adenylyltransferase, partial [Patescibacteria group bacterium]
MLTKLDIGAIKIVEELEKNGFEGWIVGGAVRDMLLGLESSDWDVATSAKPEQIEPLFHESFYDNEYGTVKVAGKHLIEQFGLSEGQINESILYDITTYRSESEYSDKRRPDSVEWGKTVLEDLKRRDFTINAIAINLKEEIVDPYGGRDD